MRNIVEVHLAGDSTGEEQYKIFIFMTFVVNSVNTISYHFYGRHMARKRIELLTKYRKLSNKSHTNKSIYTVLLISLPHTFA